MSPTPNIEHLKEGSYLISVVDNNECYKEFGPIVLVDYDEECLKVPNAFTPNEDGVNDTWILENIELYPQATVNVYNKWGQKMYEARGAENPWDGTYNGKLLPTSTYLYVINLYDGSKPVTGTVTIIH
jgi:gliding motility-associated-like protein